MALIPAKKKSGDYPAAWDKLTVKSIQGIVIEYKKDIQGKPGANAITLEVKDKLFTVWIDKVLLGYEEYYVPGAEIKFTYLGKKKGSRGFEFNDYTVEIEDEPTDIVKESK